ncbi:MAG: peptidase dimerization domain-containing protein [Gemmatimonadaceae bacterium]|nr:peptidase dimerization domain-containing protein [Gemmatimonadaceae bacterium]
MKTLGRLTLASLLLAGTATAQDARLERLKAEAATKVEARAKLVQEIIDMVFSFGELGMQEVETSKYLTGLLEKEGFRIERNVAGIPTAWTATWGSGKPVIALGSDIDGIPQSNQKPGVGYRESLVTLAPGHGEGHNSGQAVNIAAALVVKEIMQRERIPGTLILWPGVAEEQVATKAHYVRAGIFKDTDVNLFTHVGNNLGVSWGQSGSNALLSVIFKFRGQTAHSAGAPWRGKSALDAVMLMAQAWEMKREHLELPQRSHYVIPDGGDQPNVVPQTASIWFYFRERDYPRTMAMFEAAKKMAEGAALMTETQVDSINIVGSAWSGHFNKTIAEVTYENIRKVGLPKWDDADIALAKGLQRELGVREVGLETQVDPLGGPVNEATRMGGGSDDIGDISWNMPTVTLRFPSNIPGLPGHNWANGISMATPLAHKGGVAGAKVQAMTLLDILLTPKVVADAWAYFRDVQTKETKYTSFLGPNDKPAIWLNADIMAKYRDEMRKYYYDPTKFRTYLDQLGIRYPTLKGIAQ